MVLMKVKLTAWHLDFTQLSGLHPIHSDVFVAKGANPGISVAVAEDSYFAANAVDPV